MRILLDTNILLRVSEPGHQHHQAAIASLKVLAIAGNTFAISSQTVYEFLAVATRAIGDRGLGMSAALADAELSKLIAALEMVYDSAAVVAELRRLALLHGISGKSIHDAHLVASMSAHGIADVLTLNVRDFSRFTGINVLDPTTIAAV